MNGLTEYFRTVISGERHGIAAALVRFGLRLVALPYGLGVRVRNVLFDRGFKTIHKAGVPVISIGNLSLGGTGKTPCVELVATILNDLGVRPVILSRGYGSEGGHNDEAMVLEENLPDVPHLQGRDRVTLAATAVEELEAEVLILDDGFQHRRLHRDLDIVLLDATRPLANEHLFPGGLLREPVSSLKRAQFLLLTRCDQAKDLDSQMNALKHRFPNTPLGTCQHEPKSWNVLDDDDIPLDAFRSSPSVAFCGLGNPAAFLTTLRNLGYSPRELRTYPDHHNYTRADVDALCRFAETLPPDGVLLTTQKDFVKLRMHNVAGRTLCALRIGLKLTSGEAEFTRLVQSVIATTGNEE
ncbi:tetraacyldisaccharide 4'-kinase [soil metagenome]